MSIQIKIFIELLIVHEIVYLIFFTCNIMVERRIGIRRRSFHCGDKR